METIASPSIWTSLADIALVNVVLSGDNAVLIALAAQALPPDQQRKAIVFGSAAAIAMRMLLTVVAFSVLSTPYLRMVGGIFLFYIAVNLLKQPHQANHLPSHPTMAAAIRTILFADLVMSLDNVLGVAAAAGGNLILLIVGMALSIPLISFGSVFMLALMKRIPAIVALGAALLGYLGGEMFFTDTALHDRLQAVLPDHALAIDIAGISLNLPGVFSALAAIAVGAWLGTGTKGRRL